MQLLLDEQRAVGQSSDGPTTSTHRLKTSAELTAIVSQFAAADGWMERVRLRIAQRWYERVYLDSDYDVWIISWMPGQSTGFHDHGESAGAFVVATGVLVEHRPGETPLEIHQGQPRTFGVDYAHDVRNVSAGPAISIHAYSPPLDEMNEYELEGSHLVPREQASARAAQLEREPSARKQGAVGFPSISNIDLMLAEARSNLRRLTPHAVYEAVAQAGAILVDIRPATQCENEGSIPVRILSNAMCLSGDSILHPKLACRSRRAMTCR